MYTSSCIDEILIGRLLALTLTRADRSTIRDRVSSDYRVSLSCILMFSRSLSLLFLANSIFQKAHFKLVIPNTTFALKIF